MWVPLMPPTVWLDVFSSLAPHSILLLPEMFDPDSDDEKKEARRQTDTFQDAYDDENECLRDNRQ